MKVLTPLVKTKKKTSGYIIRSAAYAALLLCVFVGFSSALNLPNRWWGLSSRSPVKLAAETKTLTFADRVAYQRAIEEVYWRHRIWPKERPDPKLSLDAVMSHAQIEKKVEDYLRDSQALEDYWQRLITPEQLQAEMDRMAHHTKQPELLREIFQALGEDPFMIAECLARPVLAQRLVGEVSGGAKDASFRAKSSNPAARLTPNSPRSFDSAQDDIAANLNNVAYQLPAILGPSGVCVDDSWTATSTTNAPSAREGHRAVWTGSEMIVWGGFFYDGTFHYFNTGGRYTPSTDSWTATSITDAPSARQYHTAVWTGSEMIVWGGYDGTNDLNTGGRYTPGTDSWTATSTSNAPAAREHHTAVWTGSEMIVWGGFDPNYSNTGGRYDPGRDSWIATTTINAPTGRELHTAVWTGSEMIVWGGRGTGSNDTNTGGRYSPGTDNWTATTITNAPSARENHTAVWAGSEMIVWSGYASGVTTTGGRYDPNTDSWAATNTSNAPSGRVIHTAVWTDSEMIVWGGLNLNLFQYRRQILRTVWCNTNTDSNCNSDGNAYNNSDSDGNNNSYSNINCYGDSDAFGYAETYAYAEVSSHTGASTIARRWLCGQQYIGNNSLGAMRSMQSGG